MAKKSDEEKEREIQAQYDIISENELLLKQNDYKSTKIVAELCEAVKALGATLPIYENYKSALDDNQTYRDAINEAQEEIERIKKQ